MTFRGLGINWDLSAIPVAAQPYAPVPQTYAAPQYQPSAYGGPLGLSQAAATAPAPVAYQPYASPLSFDRPRKSRTTYIVLGIFLGALGVHNFYSGYVGRAVGQLCLTVLTLGYLGVISWIWAIIEICIVEKDSTGLNFS